MNSSFPDFCCFFVISLTEPEQRDWQQREIETNALSVLNVPQNIVVIGGHYAFGFAFESF
jgi:hypothetical protein